MTNRAGGLGKGLAIARENRGEDPTPPREGVWTREELKEIFHEVLLEYGLVKIK